MISDSLKGLAKKKQRSDWLREMTLAPNESLAFNRHAVGISNFK